MFAISYRQPYTIQGQIFSTVSQFKLKVNYILSRPQQNFLSRVKVIPLWYTKFNVNCLASTQIHTLEMSVAMCFKMHLDFCASVHVYISIQALCKSLMIVKNESFNTVKDVCMKCKERKICITRINKTYTLQKNKWEFGFASFNRCRRLEMLGPCNKF